MRYRVCIERVVVCIERGFSKGNKNRFVPNSNKDIVGINISNELKIANNQIDCFCSNRNSNKRAGIRAIDGKQLFLIVACHE